MRLYLVHHADALSPAVDAQRPLSSRGLAQAEWLAERAKAAGCAPAAIWHSGKLRARQTAEPFYRLCSPFAEFRMVRGLLPDDPPQHARDLVTGEERDVLLAGHMPNLRDVLRALAPEAEEFPLHGIVLLETADGGHTWRETWRATPG
jgi:phosphohistidine phosphatase